MHLRLVWCADDTNLPDQDKLAYVASNMCLTRMKHNSMADFFTLWRQGGLDSSPKGARMPPCEANKGLGTKVGPCDGPHDQAMGVRLLPRS
jgi:hypothetical protein